MNKKIIMREKKTMISLGGFTREAKL